DGVVDAGGPLPRVAPGLPDRGEEDDGVCRGQGGGEALAARGGVHELELGAEQCGLGTGEAEHPLHRWVVLEPQGQSARRRVERTDQCHRPCHPAPSSSARSPQATRDRALRQPAANPVNAAPTLATWYRGGHTSSKLDAMSEFPGGADFFGRIPLFREFARLLASESGPVNWELARQVAVATAVGAD